jgi:hypothetical protein
MQSETYRGFSVWGHAIKDQQEILEHSDTLRAARSPRTGGSFRHPGFWRWLIPRLSPKIWGSSGPVPGSTITDDTSEV